MDDYNIPPSNPYKRKKMNDHVKHTNMPSDIVYKMQLDRFEVFKAQDQENGHFDCILEIGTEKLYCHKFVLATASVTFNSLLSKRWNKNNDNLIKIDNSDYTYECFNKFLTFVYSGDFNLTMENIYVLTDMAEYYGVQLLKEQCEEFFLSNIKITFDNIEEMAEFAQKYSIKRFLIEISDFVESNFLTIINAQQFFNHRKSFIEFLSITERDAVNEETFFVVVCNWALHQALKKKIESKDESFDGAEFIKTELSGILPNIKFSRLNFSFVKEFILPKRAIFSSHRIYEIITKCKRNNEEEDECFKILYETAEAEIKVNMKKTNVNDHFIFTNAIENELIHILPNVKFFDMSFKFLMGFVVEKGIFLTPLDICMLYSKKCSIFGGMTIEDGFKAIYELAKKQVLMKQKFTNDAALNIQEAIKIELSVVLPQVQFCHMSNKFLREFAIGKGIISEEQANHIFDVCINITHDNKILYGIFKDDYGIMEATSSFGHYVNPDAENKVCFPNLKFKYPTIPSTVTKSNDVDWYLCFDENRCLAVKHRSVINEKDYLIVEMKTVFVEEEFMFDTNKIAHLTANWKNI